MAIGDYTEEERKIFTAAALDAGNRSMRVAGRVQWNYQDFNTASDTLLKLTGRKPQETLCD